MIGIENHLSALVGMEDNAHMYAAEVLESLGHPLRAVKRLGAVAVIVGMQPGAAIMLQTHTDVVPPADGWHTNPYEVVPVDDGRRLRGLGVSDAKGAAAVYLSLAERYAQDPPPVSVVLEFVDQEETDGAGTFALEPVNRELAEEFPLRGCILGEPTNGVFGVSRNGATKYKLTFQGQGGHGGQYVEDADTALHHLAKFTSTLRDLETTWRSRYADAGFALPSANITNARFGEDAYNQIPGQAHAVLDVRMPPSMISDIKRVAAELEAVGLVLTPLSHEVPTAPECPKTSLLRLFLTDTYPHIPQTGMFYASDMQGLQDAGWDTVHYSEGDQRRMHVANEDIDRQKLHDSETFLLDLIAHFASYTNRRA